jgi:Tfp pilus assembly protein PilN
MRPLFLDYRRDNPAQHRIGMMVLVLEVVAVLAMGTYFHKVAGRAARLEEQVTQAEHKLHPGRSGAKTSAADTQQAGAEIKVANDVIMRLSLPWSELFNALEEANSSNIALLGIEPDAGKRLVRVSGEAKDSAALFAYIRILQANKAMTSVYLKHQQVQEHNPERPIRFTLDASWT